MGGAPEEDLSRTSVSTLLEQLNLSNLLTLRDFNVDRWRGDLSSAGSNTIFLNPGAAPADFDVTFNVQLYHYGSRVRLGESSGSLHASAGIPVVFEMNGSEIIENIKTVKIPYSDSDDVATADFKSAARRIVDLVDSGKYQELLDHNRETCRVWNKRSVGRLYINFLEDVSKERIVKGAS